MYLQDGGEGDAVVRSYVDAMTAGNWSQAADLYHDESPVFDRISDNSAFDNYEEYLREREAPETWEDIDPEIDAIQEFYHATEVTEESISSLGIQVGSEHAEMVDEFRAAIAFLEVKPENLNREDEGESDEGENPGEYYEDGTLNDPLTCNLVLVDGEWSLWTARGIGVY
jgi:hypothetical protein